MLARATLAKFAHSRATSPARAFAIAAPPEAAPRLTIPHRPLRNSPHSCPCASAGACARPPSPIARSELQPPVMPIPAPPEPAPPSTLPLCTLRKQPALAHPGSA